MTTLAHLLHIERLGLAVAAARNVRDASHGRDMSADRVAVVTTVRQYHQAGYVPQNLDGTLHVGLIAGNQLQADQPASAIGHGTELGVPAAFCFSQALLLSGLTKMAGILVHLDVTGVDDFQLVWLRGSRRPGHQPPEHSPFGPATVEAVDAVPLAVAHRQLIPLTSGDEYPPDSTQSFEKIRRWTAPFTNVRSGPGLIELIFLRARKARPATLPQSLLRRARIAQILDFSTIHFVHTS